MKNKVVAMLRAKKKAYFHKYFKQFKNNSKKMWDGINLALEQTRHKKLYHCQLRTWTVHN